MTDKPFVADPVPAPEPVAMEQAAPAAPAPAPAMPTRSNDPRDLRHEAARHTTAIRALIDAPGGLTKDGEAEYERRFNEAQDLIGRAEKIERLEAFEAQLAAERPPAPTAPSGTSSRQDAALSGSDDRNVYTAIALEEYHRAFNTFAIGGLGALQRIAPSLTSPQARSLVAGIDEQGGHLLPTEIFMSQLIREIDEALPLRQYANVMRVASIVPIGIPRLTKKPSDFEWTSEVGEISIDTQMKFGKMTLTPVPIRKGIRVSRTLLNESPETESIVRSEMSQVLAETQERAFSVGTGNAEPLGLFAPKAFSAARQISTGNSTTAPTFDGLKNALMSMKPGHQARAVFVFHREVLLSISKIKDGNNQYLFQPRVTERDPQLLLGAPVVQLQYAPSTMTTGKIVGLVGNLSRYRIVELRTVFIQRLVEKYSATDEIGFHFGTACDAAPDLEEAFALIKLT